MESNIVKKLTVYRETSRGEEQKFEIKIGEIYYVGDKMDYSAPDGFQAERTSKIPNPIEGAKMTNLVAEDVRRSSSDPESLKGKYYDTCLTANSLRLKSLLTEPGELETQLETIQEHIIEPVEAMYGVGSLSPTNYEFWTSPRGSVRIFKNKFFDTKEPEQLLQLYLLLMNHELSPEKFEKRSAYQFSQYTVKNFEDTTDSATKNQFDRNSAVFKFMQQLDSNTENIGYMLEYIGVSGVAGFTAKEELNAIFNMYLDDDIQNTKTFLKDFEYLMSKTGQEVLSIYKMLIKLDEKNQLDKFNNEYYLDGQELGIKLKDVAGKVAEDKNLKKVISEMYKKVN